MARLQLYGRDELITLNALFEQQFLQKFRIVLIPLFQQRKERRDISIVLAFPDRLNKSVQIRTDSDAVIASNCSNVINGVAHQVDSAVSLWIIGQPEGKQNYANHAASIGDELDPLIAHVEFIVG